MTSTLDNTIADVRQNGDNTLDEAFLVLGNGCNGN